MILTLTPNPSIDATMQLGTRLRRGLVHRPTAITQVAGGKGVNVTHALNLAEKHSLALFPADNNDPFVALARQTGIPFHSVPVSEGVRINTTLTEPDGTTTKINGLGAKIEPPARRIIEETLVRLAENASWLVMAGSLPPGVPAGWYTELITAVRTTHPDLPIAVDTSDAPMIALGEGFGVAAPTLIKPNGLELGQLVNRDGGHLEQAATRGDYTPVVDAARMVVERGVEEVLVTLGAAGGVLVTRDGVWHATPPPIHVVSTVGAGDSSLAGYLMARAEGEEPADCLVRAIAYGTAAAGLPGTTLPSPAQLNLEETHVRHLA